MFIFKQTKPKSSKSKSSFNNPKSLKKKLLDKIIESHTKALNISFVIIIIASCFITTLISYYEQSYKFKQELLNKTELAHQRIEVKIQNYQKSLDLVKIIMLEDNRYLDSTKILQLLRLKYTIDEHLSLLPLSWYPSNEPAKSYSAFGDLLAYPDENLLNILKNNPPELLVSEQLDNLGRLSLSLVYPVIEEDNDNQDKTQELLGYLKVNIQTLQLVQKLEEILSVGDLIKLSNEDKSIYFRKLKDGIQEDRNPFLNKYKFSEELNFSIAPYRITIAQDNEQFMANALQAINLRCGIILILGSIMLITYNYVERKKAKRTYNDNAILIEEISSQEKQIQALAHKLEVSSNTVKNLTQQKNNFITSSDIISEIEQQIKQSFEHALVKIQDISQLKHHNGEKQVTPEIIKKTLASIHEITEDLSNNLASRNTSHNNSLTAINLADLFKELFILFAPLVNSRSLKIQQKIWHIEIISDELLLKRVLISLLFRVFSSSPENTKIKIIAKKEPNATIIIELINEGYKLSEQMISSIISNSSKDLPSNFTNILLDHKFIETIIKKILSGELKIQKKNHDNKISLSLPLKPNKYEASDKVIDFYQITK